MAVSISRLPAVTSGNVCCEPSNELPLRTKPLRWLYFPVRITARLGPQMELVTRSNCRTAFLLWRCDRDWVFDSPSIRTQLIALEVWSSVKMNRMFGRSAAALRVDSSSNAARGREKLRMRFAVKKSAKKQERKPTRLLPGTQCREREHVPLKRKISRAAKRRSRRSCLRPLRATDQNN